MIDWVVSDVDQRYDAPALAVSTTAPPSQNVVGPPAVIVAGGGVVSVMVTVPEAEKQLIESVTTTL